MAYDAARQRVVLFGGVLGGLLSDTWEWDGKAWVPQLVSVWPTGRYSHAMAYDAAQQRVVLFGGSASGYHSDTWFYGIGGVPSRAAPYGASCGPTLAAATNSRPIIDKQFTLNSTGFATARSERAATKHASRYPKTTEANRTDAGVMSTARPAKPLCASGFDIALGDHRSSELLSAQARPRVGSSYEVRVRLGPRVDGSCRRRTWSATEVARVATRRDP